MNLLGCCNNIENHFLELLSNLLHRPNLIEDAHLTVHKGHIFHPNQSLHLQRKIEERKMASTYLNIPNVNERQAEMIKIYADNPKDMYTVKDFQSRFMVTPTTIKSDLSYLMDIGMIKAVPLNKVKRGYVKGDKFDEVVSKLKK